MGNPILEQLIAGYSNAQSRIQDLDTKSQILIGFESAIVALIIAKMDQLHGAEASASPTPDVVAVSNTTLGILWSLPLSLGIVSILLLFCTLIARPPSKNLRHTILFPFYNPDCDQAKMEAAIDNLSNGEPLSNCVEEYRHQLLEVGAILFKKIRWNRTAVYLIMAQLSIIAVTAVATAFS